ncbi:TrgA family protein [Puniceibacterium confluentis]|uniref:TrgA family protein n=1 Tax=Puniceibacterium confluentis TaxID=1958944 RepID=UPI0011B3EE83|nr:TrgA family protein [Puniceibacterium confluentis]
MPTAAKLFSAVCLAILGYLVSEAIKPLMPEGTGFGIFSYLNATIGFFCGWVIVGNRAGRGVSAAISNGLTGMFAMVCIGLFVQAVVQMVDMAMRHRFSGPVEAFAAVFEIAIEYGGIMMHSSVLILLLVGALVTGFVSEFAARNYR